MLPDSLLEQGVPPDRRVCSRFTGAPEKVIPPARGREFTRSGASTRSLELALGRAGAGGATGAQVLSPLGGGDGAQAAQTRAPGRRRPAQVGGEPVLEPGLRLPADVRQDAARVGGGPAHVAGCGAGVPNVEPSVGEVPAQLDHLVQRDLAAAANVVDGT